MTIKKLYERLLKAEINGQLNEELDRLKEDAYDPYQIDCLLNPEKCTPVWRLGQCNCPTRKRNTAGQVAFSKQSQLMKTAMP